MTGSVLLPGSRCPARGDGGLFDHRSPRDVGRGCSVTSVSIIGDDTVLEAGVQLAGARVPEKRRDPALRAEETLWIRTHRSFDDR